MSEENQSNSKTDSAANGDCRPVPCSAEYRIKAKRSLMAMFKIPEGYSSGEVESIVDNIIWAAVHQVAELQMESMKPNA
jgi:hypothetical protein